MATFADESEKRYETIKEKLKDYKRDVIDVDGELIHVVINKIRVINEHTVVYCIPKSRPRSTEEIKIFRKKYINMPALFEGHLQEYINEKFCYIDCKVVCL